MNPALGKILIVDDEPSLLRMIGLYLERRGYVVATSDNTDRAWEMVESDPSAYAVAVVDGSMAGMGMQELALRILRASPTLCVLAASGYPVDMTALAAAAPGRVAFLHKPFTPETLAKAVRRLLGQEEENV